MKKRHHILIGLAAAMFLAAINAPTVVQAGSADLSWTANAETDLAGYKVYRGNAANGTCPIGPLQPLKDGNGNPVSVGKVTAYTDNTVPVFDGELCYELTAFDTAGNESTHSNRATKQVNLVPPGAPNGLTIPAVRP